MTTEILLSNPKAQSSDDSSGSCQLAIYQNSFIKINEILLIDTF